MLPYSSHDTKTDGDIFFVNHVISVKYLSTKSMTNSAGKPNWTPLVGLNHIFSMHKARTQYLT